MPRPGKNDASGNDARTKNTAQPKNLNEPGTASASPHPYHLTESLTNASIDSMVAFDNELNITLWNQTTELWSGLKVEDVIGKPFFEVMPKAADTPGLQAALGNAIKGFKSFLPAGAGFYFEGHYEAHFVPLRSEAGTVYGILQILHDVAHRIKAENELKALNLQLTQQYRALQHANEELANFTKIASHDLKEPLRKIYTFSELIMVHEAGKLSNSGRSNFRRIQKSVQRMGLLTDDIVSFTEINASRETLSAVDLNSILFLATEPLRPAIAQSGAMIITEEMPVMQGRPQALSQLFRHVLGNALKFQEALAVPKIHIRCSLVSGGEIKHPEASAAAEYYHLSFQDNGIGFDPQYSEKIFGMFQRLHPEGEYRGSGMGLSIAQKVAQMHGGFMTAESGLGSGSIFHCYLRGGGEWVAGIDTIPLFMMAPYTGAEECRS